jgi:hypothetical protein
MSAYYSSSTPKEDPPLVPSYDGTCMVLGQERSVKKCLFCGGEKTVVRENYTDAALAKKYNAVKMEIERCNEFHCGERATKAIFIYPDKSKKKIEDYFGKQQTKKKPK